MKSFLLLVHVVVIYMAVARVAAGPLSGDLFHILAKSSGSKNFAFSPFSVEAALFMAYAGAGGDTANEIRRVLTTSGEEPSYKDFGRRVGEIHYDIGLNIANRVFVNENLELQRSFNNKVALFRAEAESVKFANPKGAVDTINTWVERQTNKKIQNLLKAEDVDSLTAVVLVNAIHFSAKWKNHKFKETRINKFFSTSPTSKMDVDVISAVGTFKYGYSEDLDANVLEMPYAKSDISMFIILPSESDGLKALEKKLGRDLNATIAGLEMYERYVNVTLPKFKFDYQVGMEKPLKKMGVSTMFSPKADFGGMLNSKELQSVSKVIHKVHLAVNKEGTEAAAATAVGFKPYSLQVLIEPVLNFYVDHPFVFVIRCPIAGILFAGHVINPLQCDIDM